MIKSNIKEGRTLCVRPSGFTNLFRAGRFDVPYPLKIRCFQEVLLIVPVYCIYDAAAFHSR